MGQSRQDNGHILTYGLGAARQIDNDCLPAYAGHGPRKHGVHRVLYALGTHGFFKAGGAALDNPQRRLRRHVAPGKAGTPRGQDHIKFQLVAPAHKCCRNQVEVIRHNGVFNHLPAQFLLDDLTDHRPAFVGTLAARAAIADCQNPRSYHAKSSSASSHYLITNYCSPGPALQPLPAPSKTKTGLRCAEIVD